MKRTLISIALAAALAISNAVEGQTIGALIRNPRISGFAYWPLEGSKIIRADTAKARKITYQKELPRPENLDYPSGALIEGIVPDPSRGWAVAITHNAEEFERALPEYRRLIAEGKMAEANEILHVSTSIGVSTKVERFVDKEKVADVPEKAGTFFFTLDTAEFLKYGGHLTFLSYTRDEEDPVVNIGKDIGETINGIIDVITVEGKQGFKYGYGMKVILAEVTENE